MSQERPLSTFRARPEQSLDEHLEGVALAGQELVDDAGTNAFGDDWGAVIETIAWTHDIGKLTEYFQEYLRTGDRTTAPTIDLTYHGTFGAFVSVIALHSRGFANETIAAGFYAVAKHHSVLQNIPTDFREYHQGLSHVDIRYETAQKQLKSIDDGASEAADDVLERATDGEIDWSALTAMLEGDQLETIRQTIEQLDPEIADEEFYGCALRTWSTLVAADKFDASNLTSIDSTELVRETKRPDVDALTDTVRSLSDTLLPDGSEASEYLDTPERPLPTDEASINQRLAAVRTAANGRASQNLLSGHEAGDRVFELTLPTGFGKTYTGLRAALQLAEHRDSRVVYALPYTSIIDQVDEEIQNVFGLNPNDPAYTKHHHLADTRSRLEDESGFRDDASSGRDTLHAEAWQSGLVLTTFTQLFESVAGPENVQSTKLPALQDSVVIVDEPQALSHNWWALVGRMTDYLAEEYDTTMLFMTATQPRLLRTLPDAPTPTPLVELQAESARLIDDAPRVQFDVHPSLVGHLDRDGTTPLPLASAAAEIETELAGTTDSLAVVNTVSCAVALTQHLSAENRVNLADELLPYLRERNGKEFDTEAYLDRLSQSHPDADVLVATLTTRLRPVDRRALLDCLDQILDSESSTPFDDTPTVTISTQLIEAGGDLSFDRLYRDYAPLPAIVQAAGRCNRRFGGDPSSVTVWRLDSPSGDSYVPSQLIYGQKSLLRPTRDALATLRTAEGGTILSESAMITDGVDKYYESLHNQRRTSHRSDDLVEAFDTAQGKKLRNASLISSEYPTQDFAVLVTDSEEQNYDSYRHFKNAGQWKKARKRFQRLKSTLVSVPVEGGLESDGPTVVSVSDEEVIYHPATGQGLLTESIIDDVEV